MLPAAFLTRVYFNVACGGFWCLLVCVVLEAVQPRKLVVVDDDTIPSAAASLCAALLHIQVERITGLGQGGEAGSGRGERGRGDHPEAAAEGRQGGGVLAKYLLDAVSQFQNQVI